MGKKSLPDGGDGRLLRSPLALSVRRSDLGRAFFDTTIKPFTKPGLCTIVPHYGEMSERLKEHAWKACVC